MVPRPNPTMASRHSAPTSRMVVGAELARQPLFVLLGAIIVLVATDANPLYGIAAAVIWALWLWTSRTPTSRQIFGA